MSNNIYFNEFDKEEMQKILYLLIFQEQLYLTSDEVELLLNRKQTIINKLRTVYININDNDINKLLSELQPDIENGDSTPEASLDLAAWDSFYNKIDIEQKDPNKPVKKTTKGLREKQVLKELDNLGIYHHEGLFLPEIPKRTRRKILQTRYDTLYNSDIKEYKRNKFLKMPLEEKKKILPRLIELDETVTDIYRVLMYMIELKEKSKVTNQTATKQFRNTKRVIGTKSMSQISSVDEEVRKAALEAEGAIVL